MEHYLISTLRAHARNFCVAVCRTVRNIDAVRIKPLLSLLRQNSGLGSNDLLAFGTEKPLFRNVHAGTAFTAEFHSDSRKYSSLQDAELSTIAFQMKPIASQNIRV